MKVLIKLSDSADVVLVLPAESAGVAAELLSRAEMFKAENQWASDPTYAPIEPSVSMRYMADSRLAGPSQAEIEAKKEAESKSDMWLREYQEHQKTKATVADLESKVSALLAATGCRLAPDPDVERTATEAGVPSA